MSNYTQQKFRLGTVCGQTGDYHLGPLLELSLVGEIALMLLGGLFVVDVRRCVIYCFCRSVVHAVYEIDEF